MEYILPPRLRPGDLVGIVHPAGPIRNPRALQQGLELLQSLGLRLRHIPPVNSGPDYLAGEDQQRLRAFHQLWADEEVRALIAARGGYGCLRLVKDLDWAFLRRHPKWLMGFSDLTVLLNAITQETGLLTLHGPLVSSLSRSDSAAVQACTGLLYGSFPPYSPAGLEILRGGLGQGRLAGGNLTTLSHLLASPWQVQSQGRILFLEDTAEPMYKIDRMLTQLSLVGCLDGLAGLILGTFDLGHEDPLAQLRLQEQIWQRVLELTSGSRYPIWGAFPVGHQRHNLPLPVGMEAVMQSSSGLLEFLPQTCTPAPCS
jgi:muramoyltetrapeptide carboxypeptidase